MLFGLAILDEIETTLVQEVKDDLNGHSFWDCLKERYFDNSHCSCDRERLYFKISIKGND